MTPIWVPRSAVLAERERIRLILAEALERYPAGDDERFRQFIHGMVHFNIPPEVWALVTREGQ